MILDTSQDEERTEGVQQACIKILFGVPAPVDSEQYLRPPVLGKHNWCLEGV